MSQSTCKQPGAIAGVSNGRGASSEAELQDSTPLVSQPFEGKAILFLQLLLDETTARRLDFAKSKMAGAVVSTGLFLLSLCLDSYMVGLATKIFSGALLALAIAGIFILNMDRITTALERLLDRMSATHRSMPENFAKSFWFMLGALLPFHVASVAVAFAFSALPLVPAFRVAIRNFRSNRTPARSQ